MSAELNPMSEIPTDVGYYVKTAGDRWFYCWTVDGQPQRRTKLPLPESVEGWVKFSAFDGDPWDKPPHLTSPRLSPCPYCGLLCECDTCDVGVGYVQCGPYYCEGCSASEIGPHDKERELTELENLSGWYAPNSEPGSSANVIGGKIVSHTEMKDVYQDRFRGSPDWEDKELVDQWWDEVRKP